MLGHHPSICKCDEMDFVAQYMAGRSAANRDIRDYKRFLAEDLGFQLSGFQVPDADEFPAVARDFFRQRRDVDKRPVYGAAVHHDFELLPEIWPHARYIYLVRDPRDVARSCVKMGWGGTPWAATSIWNAAHDSWAKLRRQLAEGQYLEIFYEDLISNPANALDSICDFLNIQYDHVMMDIDRDTTYAKPSITESRSWRESASVREVSEVEAKAGDRLVDAGYAKSNNPKMKLGAVNVWYLRIASAFNRTRFRCKRYGYWLWAAELLTRRFGIKKLHGVLIRRTQGVDVQHFR